MPVTHTLIQAAALLFCVSAHPGAPEPPPAHLRWGPPIAGLRLALTVKPADQVPHDAFQLFIQNVGTQPALLIDEPLRSHVRFQITHPNGRTEWLDQLPYTGGIAPGRSTGRLIDLRPKHTTNFSVQTFRYYAVLRKLRAANRGKSVILPLPPGRYRIVAEYSHNLKRPGLDLWSGTIVSAPLTVVVRAAR